MINAQAQARQLFRPLFTQFAAPNESPVNYEKINNEEKIQQEKKSIPKRKSFDALRTSFFVENQSSAIDRNSALYDALKRQSGLENVGIKISSVRTTVDTRSLLLSTLFSLFQRKKAEERHKLQVSALRQKQKHKLFEFRTRTLPLSVRRRGFSTSHGTKNMGSSNSFPRVNDLTQSLKKTKTDDDINASDNPKDNTSKLFAIGCGFGKDDNPKQSITKKLHCIDNKSSARNFGEDAAFISSTGTTDVFGVADGVGGWRNHGVDPSKFSRALVQKLEDLVKKGEFDVRQPVQLLARAYNRMYAIEDMMGSSTACIVSFDRKTKVLYTANLGDSGFLVIRDGKVVHQSRPQTHGFNAPWQLSIVPETMRKGSYGDSPHKADFTEFQCQYGDIVVLATDGMFDNVPNSSVLALLEKFNINSEQLFGSNDSGNESDSSSPNQTAFEHNFDSMADSIGHIVEYTRMCAHDQNYLSPFAIEARKYGYRATTGGKVDDITVLVGIVGREDLIY